MNAFVKERRWRRGLAKYGTLLQNGSKWPQEKIERDEHSFECCYVRKGFMKKIKHRKVIARLQTAKRMMTALPMIPFPMAAKQQVSLPRLPRSADLLYIPGGEKHFTSAKIRNLEIDKADRLL